MRTDPERWRDLLSRSALAAIGFPVVLVIAVAAPHQMVAALVLVAVALGGAEYVALRRPEATGRERCLGALGHATVAASLIAGAPAWGWPWGSGAAGLLAAAVLASVGPLLSLQEWRARSGSPRGSRARGPTTIWVALGLVWWAVAPCCFAILRRDLADGPALCALALGASWGGDIGGYLVGRRFGRTPLARSLSPRKTLEGSAGSLAVALGAGLAAAAVTGAGVGRFLLLAGAANFGAQAGDLAESALKRRYGARHSGRLHAGGGILDSMDGLTGASVVLYLVAWLEGVR